MILILALLLAVPALSQERAHARSMVITRQGIVSTSQALASQAGAQVLARGGSAIDAAIAANAVLGVTEPQMNGIGGDLFVLYWDAKTGKLTGLNSSGWAPQGLSIDFLKKNQHKQMPRTGIHSATAPGCVEGWEKLHRRFGRLPWKDLFESAIYYAQQGFPVTEVIAGTWGATRNKDAPEFAAERRVFFPNGRAPRVGEVFRNPDLAGAYERIAAGGADAFYRGPIAEAILKTSRLLGGTLAAGDLAEFSAEWVEPISTNYRGWTVYELPPNGQGMAALQMLNILSQFEPAAPQSAEDLHRKIEAMKLAYADLRRYVADPRFASVPTAGLLSMPYAAQRARLIDPEAARCTVGAGTPIASGDTTYLAVVDREGNIASWIQSVSAIFGSGVVVDGMGFHLHNRGGGFSLDPKHPNALAPRKRPFHTIIPAFLEKGNLHIGFGIMGGSNQPQAHAQFVSNLVDFKMNLQAAMEAPRFSKRVLGDCTVSVEGRMKPEVREALARRGHKLDVRADYSMQVGRGEAVMHDAAAKVNYGASSAQGDGAAMPEPAPRQP